MPRPRFPDPNRPTDSSFNRLPHRFQRETCYFVTFNLADALPMEKVRRLKRDRDAWVASKGPRPWSPEVEREHYRRFSGRIEHWLDLGSGTCLLRDPENARLVADTLRFHDAQRCHLHAWVVMPNHVHVLFDAIGSTTLSELLHSWKGYSARQINLRMRRSGTLWQKSYFDRMVRDAAHFGRCVRYIRNNPQKAKLSSGYLLGLADEARRVL